MTKREFFEMATTGTLTAEGREMAEKMLAAMDASNAKRQDAAAEKKAVADAPIMEAIREVLSAEPKLTAVIAKEVEQTSPKVSALLIKMEKTGEVVKSEVSVKGKGKQKAWALAGN